MSRHLSTSEPSAPESAPLRPAPPETAGSITRRESMREILQDELEHGGRHSQLEVHARMELEFELCQRERLPVCLLRIAVDELERIAPARARQDAMLRGIVDILRSYPRTGDLFGCREGAAILVLLPRTTTEAAELMCRLLIEACRRLMLPGAKAPVRASLSIGLAHAQPDLDLYFETLNKVAFEGVRVASASGSECFVHTQLYGLYQSLLERQKGRRPAPIPAANSPVPGVGSSSPAQVSSVALGAAGAATGDVPSPTGPDFDERVRAEVSRVAAHEPALHDLEERLVALAHTCAHGAVEHALAVQREKHAEEIDQLQRRITKLARTLDDTEEELRRLVKPNGADRGVASAYRFVQGLPAQEEGYEQKLGLLAAIVDANLALQKSILHPQSA